MLSPPTFWRQQSEFVSSRQSGQTLAAVRIGFECHCNGQNGCRFNPFNPELNPICCLLALLAHHFLHVSRIRVKSLTLKLLMSYIYDISSLRVNQLLYCVSLKIYSKFANYFCELKFSGNTHQRP